MLDADVALDVAADFGVAESFGYGGGLGSTPATQELVALGVGVDWGLGGGGLVSGIQAP